MSSKSSSSLKWRQQQSQQEGPAAAPLLDSHEDRVAWIQRLIQAIQDEDAVWIREQCFAVLLQQQQQQQQPDAVVFPPPIMAALRTCHVQAMLQLEANDAVIEYVQQQQQQQQQRQQPSAKSDDYDDPDFFKAALHYAWYRQELYEDIIQTYNDGSSSSNMAYGALSSHVYAQALFHNGQVPAALRMYNELLQNLPSSSKQQQQQQIHSKDADLEQERQRRLDLWTNFVAVLVAHSTPYVRNDVTDLPYEYSKVLEQIQQALQQHMPNNINDTLSSSPLSVWQDALSYDLALNVALWLWTSHSTSTSTALQYLDAAVTACRHQQQEEDIVVAEIAPLIWTRHVYGPSLWSGIPAMVPPPAVPDRNVLALPATMRWIQQFHQVCLDMQRQQQQQQSAKSAVTSKQGTAWTALLKEDSELSAAIILPKFTPLQICIVAYNIAAWQCQGGYVAACETSCDALQAWLEQAASVTPEHNTNTNGMRSNTSKKATAPTKISSSSTNKKKKKHAKNAIATDGGTSGGWDDITLIATWLSYRRPPAYMPQDVMVWWISRLHVLRAHCLWWSSCQSPVTTTTNNQVLLLPSITTKDDTETSSMPPMGRSDATTTSGGTSAVDPAAVGVAKSLDPKQVTAALKVLDQTRAELAALPVSNVRDHALLYVAEHATLLRVLHQRLIRGSTKNGRDNAVDDDDDDETAMMEIWLHMLQEDIPASLQSKPAVMATLAALYQHCGDPEAAEAVFVEHTNNSRDTVPGTTVAAGHLLLADFYLGQGDYHKAVEILEKQQAGNTVNRHMTAQARLVQALSYIDPGRAIECWSGIQTYMGRGANRTEIRREDEILAAELEYRPLPRSTIKAFTTTAAGAGTAGGGVCRGSVGKIDALSSDAAVAVQSIKQQRSHDAILQRRARQREVYLQELERKGLYRSDRPTKPDPERWIPKYDRSYSRRRRGRGGTNAAGGGSATQGGINAKDAAHLDVAARQAARTRGEVDDGGSNVRSTAHMAVVSSSSIGVGPSSRKSKGSRRR